MSSVVARSAGGPLPVPTGAPAQPLECSRAQARGVGSAVDGSNALGQGIGCRELAPGRRCKARTVCKQLAECSWVGPRATTLPQMDVVLNINFKQLGCIPIPSNPAWPPVPRTPG